MDTRPVGFEFTKKNGNKIAINLEHIDRYDADPDNDSVHIYICGRSHLIYGSDAERFLTVMNAKS